MRNFRKRTIALCLASAITVLGSFAVDSYQNSIMSISVDNSSYGNLNVTAYTKQPYARTPRTEKVDDNTYNIFLPGANNEIIAMPKITGMSNVDSIHVSTYPYSLDIEGYTVIKIKTKGNPSVNTMTSLYIPDKKVSEPTQIAKTTASTKSQNVAKQEQSYWQHHETSSAQATKTSTQKKTEQVQKTTSFKEKNVTKEEVETNNVNMPVDRPSEKTPILIGIILLAFLISFIIFLNKDKMASIVGDQKDFDFDDKDNENTPKKKKKKRDKYRNTINKLDNTYKNTQYTGNVNIVTGQAIQQETPDIEKTFEKENPEPNSVILDLDSLYSEKNKSEQNEDSKTESNNSDYIDDLDDLAELMNEFTSDEDKDTAEEDLYQSTINNQNLNFSKNDSSRLNKLLQNEIGDETLNNIEEFAPKNNEPPKPPTETELMEKVLAEYTIKQNISFSKDDVDTIRKLINVELDETFITDLRTNPQRTAAMQQELENKEKKPHKTSEMLILNVKDLLPDLSKEMKKQGKKKIESNAKPEVIYYSEGYEVSKLSVSSDLANVSKAVHDNKDATKFRPSDDLPIVENGYEVQTLSVQDKLPNISDYKLNPLKYEPKKNVQKADEKTLLNSIANVQFKPFYEEVHDELNQFEGFEIVENDEEKTDEIVLKKSDEPNKQQIKHKKPIQTSKVNDDAKKLLELIEEQQAEREIKKMAKDDNNIQKDTTSESDDVFEPIVCEVNGTSYSILKSVFCGNNLNCLLAKNDNGYDIIGQMGSEYKILKHYDQLQSENFQARISETDSDGYIKYLIRISVHKFIIKVKQNNMEFVMDLC